MPLAQFPGTCVDCGDRIQRGTEFAWGEIRGSRKHAPYCPEQMPHVDVYADGTASTLHIDTPNGIVDRETGEIVETAQHVESIKEWSPLQEVIFAATLNNSDNLLVDAKPGSGKTTTAKEAAIRYKAAHPEARIILLAFNKEIAKELQTKMRSTGIEASTVHSFWYRVVTANSLVLREPTDNKLREIGNRLVKQGQLDRETAKKYLSGACKLVSKAKGVAGIGVPGLAPDTADTWIELLERFEIQFGDDSNNSTPIDVTTGIDLARRLLALSIEETTVVDFDDMVYLPALHGWAPPQFDLIFVDEAQDTNPLRRHLLRPMLAPGGRIFAVGDPYQSIYSFAGADCDAMDLIQQDYNCTVLPLDVSYRCPQTVVAEAQRLVSSIKASPNAPMGVVESLAQCPLRSFADEQTSAILCRNTAPLVQLAYRLLTAGIPCKVLGKDIGKGLINLINKMNAVDLEDLQERLFDYNNVEGARLARRNEEAKAAALNDKVTSILAIVGGLPTAQRTIPGLISQIDTLFGRDDTKGCLVLSTVHKAKGREWPHVYILDRSLMPSPYAKTDEQQQQERNIEYVAVTRAQERLSYIITGGIV